MSSNRFAGRLAVPFFLGCLLVGVAVVAWRATSRSNTLKAAGRAEVASQAAAVEAQLNQTVAAAQALALLARQSGGPIPNFSRTATDLLAGFPSVDAVALEQNGIVSDIIPRAGHERVMGLNIMNDPAQRASAQAAMQRRAMTVAGPLLLPGADLGIVARVPIYQRGRDGRETFWGFVSASTRLSKALANARVTDLPWCGYNYICYVPAVGDQHPLTVSSYGPVTAKGAVQQAVKIQNAEIRLAVEPRSGWFSKLKFGIEIFAVLIFSGLVGLLINALESRQAVESSLAEANQQVSRDNAERQRHQEDMRVVKENATAMQARQAEVEQTRTALQQAQQTIAELQSRLQTVGQTEKENAATVLVRLQQDQATIADLQAHLDAATRTAREAADASAAKIAELETSNQQLTARIAAAAHYEARVAELTVSLQRAEEEAGQWKLATVALREAADARAEDVVTPPAVETVVTESTEPEKPRSERRRKARPLEEPAEPVAETPAVTAAEPAPEPLAEPEPLVDASSSHHENGATHQGAEAEPIPPEVAAAINHPEPATAAAADPVFLDTEPVPAEKPAKPAKRKKVRRADQMDFFGAEAADDDAPAPAVEARVPEPREQTASLFNFDTDAEKPAAKPASTPDEKSAAELEEKAVTAVPTETETQVAEAEPVVAAAQAVGEVEAAPAPDPKLHAKVLRRFVEEYARVPERIRDDLVLGDSAAAQKTIEALKSAASDAGANDVHEAAVALSRAIHDQADPAATEFLWADLQKAVHDLAGDVKPAPKAKSEKPKPARSLPPPPPVDPTELRTAVGMIVPLLMDQDPGAKDCLKDNRDTFRSTFTSEGYVEFEDALKGDDYPGALEQLRKAIRKHGITV